MMLFVLQVDVLMGTPGKHDWFKMDDAEKDKWRKFEENFVYPDNDPDWME